MTTGGKLTPNLNQESTKILNLTVLQRIDPCIEEILLTATHVTFYEFNIELNQWSRKDVEGSLFVVKRNTQPRFQFVVMNRRNTDNLVENLLGDFEYEVQAPYLLYRNDAQEVNGIWFYNSRECEDVANLIFRITNAYSKVPPKLKVPAPKSEFEELEKVPTSAVIEGPLEPPSTSSNHVPIVESSSFMNFFSPAMHKENNTSSLKNSVHPYQSLSPSALSLSVPTTLPSPAISPHVPSRPPSTPPLPFYNAHDPVICNNQATSLVKPSSFTAAPSSSSTLIMAQSPSSAPFPASDAYRPLNMQGQYGIPMLQHFPPPAPSPSLTPVNTCMPINERAISRDKVRDAVLMLVQDNQFIDKVYQALLRAHKP